MFPGTPTTTRSEGERGEGDGRPATATATSGARPSHGHDLGGKQEKERGIERPRKREKGGRVWPATVTTTVDGDSLGGLESGDRYEPRKPRVSGLGFRTLGVKNR